MTVATRKYEFIAVFANLASLLTGVKAFASLGIRPVVQFGLDNMYNVCADQPNVYLLNFGALDAKGTHHVFGSALTLGRAAPRNEVVGAAWFHAHEWVRRNAAAIVAAFNTHPNRELRTNVAEVLGLSPLVFVACGTTPEGSPLWEKHYPGLGACVFAFPKTTNTPTAFARDLDGPMTVFCMSDGDHGMWNGFARGVGDGRARDNRCGTDHHIDGCCFHGLAAIEKMFDRAIVKHRGRRDAAGPKSYDDKHPLGVLLDGKASYHTIFGDFVDETVQHDVGPVARTCWDMGMQVAKDVGMGDDVDKIALHHDPTSGREGKLGRSQQTYEIGASDTTTHPLQFEEGGEQRRQLKGNPSTANGVEGRINKRTKEMMRKPQPLASLVTGLCAILTEVTRETVGKVGYSLLPDWLGQCDETQHRTKAGRAGKEQTGRTGYADMKGAIAFLQDGGTAHAVYNVRLSGVGATAEYIMSSDKTIYTVAKMIEHHAYPDTDAKKKALVRVLRDAWMDFIDDPKAHVQGLWKAVPLWDVTQVRSHLLDHSAFMGRGDQWRGTPAQVHRIMHADVMYQCGAFHRVVPRPNRLLPEEALVHMSEPFRLFRGPTPHPWDVDLGYFECLHCVHYSKRGFCKHCSIVIIFERLLPGLPLEHAGFGLAAGQHCTTTPVLKDRRGVDKVNTDPPGRTAYTPMRYKSTPTNRGKFPTPPLHEVTPRPMSPNTSLPTQCRKTNDVEIHNNTHSATNTPQLTSGRRCTRRPTPY